MYDSTNSQDIPLVEDPFQVEVSQVLVVRVVVPFQVDPLVLQEVPLVRLDLEVHEVDHSLDQMADDHRNVVVEVHVGLVLSLVPAFLVGVVPSSLVVDL